MSDKGPYECQPPLPNKEKTKPEEGELQKLASRVSQLEGLTESLAIVVQSLNEYRQINDTNVNELRTKLKETIVSVERLAKGHSFGNLGLPSLEAWNNQE
ncbi:hypothetical protein LCGC14_0330120 [marine sediment metagenome]|uniref:Uncharacterized protein n=1 Tax=marine sediment metagenome TaxID=412755 RepID=A0A0F9TMD9_9ZZZZ